ncbi:hypothetical protein T492DRAFT_585618 [Pavlovales sp. CCMP2436]|nr:hypothetical protein T492DRAFT_585618 [Pavlovales sp. CCMP2436]
MGAKIVPAASAAEPPVWDGRYFDPNHPRGYREVSLDGSTLTIVGRDEPNGLKWTLKAITFGSTANIDFTPKGGPKDLPAKLQAGMIIFPDGNNWTKLSKWDGRYADANHPQGYRDVSVRGNVLTIVGRDDKASAEWKVLATVNGDSASIDFSPKGGPKDLGAKLQDGKIVFPDGNAWPKIE